MTKRSGNPMLDIAGGGRRRHAARKRAREAPRQIARREQELGICAKEIPNTPQGTVKISAFMDTVGEFYLVLMLHKYPTVCGI